MHIGTEMTQKNNNVMSWCHVGECQVAHIHGVSSLNCKNISER